MNLKLESPVLSLEAGQLLALDDARGTRIQPRQGVVWVTEEGEAQDFIVGAGESFVVLLRTMRDDPADRFEPLGLVVAGRRRLPPTARLLRSGGLTIDSFLLRGAEIGTGWCPGRGSK